MFKAKLKEAVICFGAGRVTLKYPFEPAAAPPKFRGKIEFDARKCIGCGGCANVCPPRCIVIEDIGEVSRLAFHLDRCIQCARCYEVCPEQAIWPTQQFETATPDKSDLESEMTLWMSSCQRCGRCFEIDNAIDKFHSKRWRGRGPGAENERGTFPLKPPLDFIPAGPLVRGEEDGS
ncbi:MAG: 4Fe-4S dicluster domain-containing protein [Armatimonadetes bacterium]|nr:4Fe-4S dicluster domain-containing protein [Armatimonadota bacterium]